MNPSFVRIVSVLASAVVVLGTGYWLAHLGRPYSAVLFNAHKLLALAAIVLFSVALFRIDWTGGWTGMKTAAAILAGVCLLALLVSGGLHSIDAAGGLPASAGSLRVAVSWAHKILPYFAALSALAAVTGWRIFS
jgi:hypothetical protein